MWKQPSYCVLRRCFLNFSRSIVCAGHFLSASKPSCSILWTWEYTMLCVFKAPTTLHPRNFKTQQSPAILDLCLRKTRSGKSHGYREAIVFEKLRFQIVSRPHENAKPAFSTSSGLKSVFEKLCFRDGLVWTVGLYTCNRRNKAVFSNFSGVVWRLPKISPLTFVLSFASW